jgi:hypothetical protein
VAVAVYGAAFSLEGKSYRLDLVAGDLDVEDVLMAEELEGDFGQPVRIVGFHVAAWFCLSTVSTWHRLHE